MRWWFYTAWIWMFCAVSAGADYYVAQAGQIPAWPHTNWSSAASNIQDAVNAAANGAVVLVSNGTYRVPTNAVINIGTNVLYITNAITLRSVNGPAATVIDGGGSNRCLFINLPVASCAFGPLTVDGFTLTNGYNYTRGAGCIIVAYGAGTGYVQNCIISGNTVRKEVVDSTAGGGGLFTYITAVVFEPIISNCVFRGNRVLDGAETAPFGGGIWMRAFGKLVDCAIVENESSNFGGGLYLRNPARGIDRCIVVSNIAAFGGGCASRDGGPLRNSLFAYNTAPGYAGGIHEYEKTQIYNCTVVSNSSGVRVRSASVNGAMQNNIIDSIYAEVGAVVTGYNNCLPSIPVYGEWHDTLITTNNPAYIGFVDAAAGDFRINGDSPCVNYGTNAPWMADALDLDKRPRLDRFTRLPDIGCYEYLAGGALFRLR